MITEDSKVLNQRIREELEKRGHQVLPMVGKMEMTSIIPPYDKFEVPASLRVNSNFGLGPARYLTRKDTAFFSVTFVDLSDHHHHSGKILESNEFELDSQEAYEGMLEDFLSLIENCMK